MSLLYYHQVIRVDVSSTIVNVYLWKLEEYQNYNISYLTLIDSNWINRQLALTTVSIGENKSKVWATVDLAKVSTLYITCNKYANTVPYL